MALKFPTNRELTIYDPEGVDDRTLFETSLSTLSKNLSETLSRHRVFAIYLRWLEVHRHMPSKVTNHWDNTLLHWTLALRARGFEQDQVVYGLKKWKHDNKLLVSRDGRYLPTAHDISKAFSKTENKMDSQRQNFSHFDGRPPGNYICNRCGEKGHHLQACPTNMDPAYDKAPDHNYVCKICHRRGLHFNSLCPKNLDPSSIIQKRKKRDLEMLEYPISQSSHDWEWGGGRRGAKRASGLGDNEGRLKEADVSPDSSQSYSPPIDWIENSSSSPAWITTDPKAEGMGKLRESDGLDMPNESIDTAEIGLIRNKADIDGTQKRKYESQTPSRESNRDTSPSPTQERRLREKIRRIESIEAQAARGESLGVKNTIWIAGKAAFQARLEALDEGVSQMDRDYDTKKECLISFEESDTIGGGALRQTDFSKLTLRPRQASTLSQESSSPDEMGVDREHRGRQKTTPFTKHSDFVQRLIRSHREMRETVNFARQGPTAVDMWEDDDLRRLQKMESAKTSLMSPFDHGYETATQYTDRMELEDGDLITDWGDNEIIQPLIK